MTDTPETPPRRFSFAALRERMNADTPIRFLSTPQDRDDFGIHWVRNDRLPPNVIMAVDPAGGPDQTVVVVNSVRETPEQAAERQAEVDATMQRMGAAIQYPASQTIRVDSQRMGRALRTERPAPVITDFPTVEEGLQPGELNIVSSGRATNRIGFSQRILRAAAASRTASRDPAESNPPREGEPSLLERIADPAYPLPPIRHMDYSGLLRPLQNVGVQAEAAAAAMQRLHNEMRALAAEFPNIQINGDMVIVNNDAQPITQEVMADALRRVTAEPTAEERERRRMERVLLFGSRYGMGRSRLMEMDFAALEGRVMSYIDTEGSFSLDSLAALYGGGEGLFGSLKKLKLPKPPKGSLLKLPSKKAPMGHTFAVIKIEETTHILGTVPACGSLTGNIDRIVRFPIQVKMSFKRNEPQHSIPSQNIAEGRVILLKDILAPQKRTRGTILHDEWHGVVRAVLFHNEAVAKSVRGFRAYKG